MTINKPGSLPSPQRVWEPYVDGGILAPPFRVRSPLQARVVAVVELRYPERPLEPLAAKSRVIRQGDIHELMLMGGEAPQVAGPFVAAGLRVLGFVEFLNGGVLVMGDVCIVGGQPIGRLDAFDGTHAPNHLNLVFTAKALGLDTGDVNLDLTSSCVFEADGSH